MQKRAFHQLVRGKSLLIALRCYISVPMYLVISDIRSVGLVRLALSDTRDRSFCSRARCQKKWTYSRASLMNENNYAAREIQLYCVNRYTLVFDIARCVTCQNNRDEFKCLVWFREILLPYVVDFIFETQRQLYSQNIAIFLFAVTRSPGDPFLIAATFQSAVPPQEFANLSRAEDLIILSIALII